MGSHANYHMVLFISQQSEKKGDKEHIKEKLNKEQEPSEKLDPPPTKSMFILAHDKGKIDVNGGFNKDQFTN